MVSFQCDGCGDIVKKPKLDAHYARCYSPVVCIDCSTTFHSPADWKAHTTCISEAEKYQKTLYQGPKKNGWNDSVPSTYGQSGRGGYRNNYGAPRSQGSGANNTPLGTPNRMTPSGPPSPTPDGTGTPAAVNWNGENVQVPTGNGHVGRTKDVKGPAVPGSSGPIDVSPSGKGKSKKRPTETAELEANKPVSRPVATDDSSAKQPKKRKTPPTESPSEDHANGVKNKKRKTKESEQVASVVAVTEKKSKKKSLQDPSGSTDVIPALASSIQLGEAVTVAVPESNGAGKKQKQKSKASDAMQDAAEANGTPNDKKKNRKSILAVEDTVQPANPPTSVDVQAAPVEAVSKENSKKWKKSKAADGQSALHAEHDSLPPDEVESKKRELDAALDDSGTNKKKKRKAAAT